MDLTCYVHPAWAPLIRPAPATRPWMDATPESFAYRCLPLNIANAHGWEVLSPCSFEAIWDGGTGVEAVQLRLPPDVAAEHAPVSLFGQGVVTFHVEGIFQTPPGWNLWVGGSPNRQKDGIAPLTGVIETDWSPFTFTMNWRFTRPGAWVRFEAFEPIAFLFPVQRGALEAFEPRFAPLESAPELKDRFQAWSTARDAFQQRMRDHPPAVAADKWQKHYYRGVDVAGESLVDDHQAKLRLKPFDRTAAPGVPKPRSDDPPLTPPATPAPASVAAATELALRKREWLLETMERQRMLAAVAAGIARRADVSGEEFLEEYYATSRPVILTGELDDWPALKAWTPEYLAAAVGPRPIQYQGGRAANARFEMDKDAHRRAAPFDAFIDLISRPGAGNDAYLTAYNSGANADAVAVLARDVRPLAKFLAPAASPLGMMWIGPAGTVTSLHHDLTNNFIAQVRGRKRLKVLPAADVGRLYNHQHVFSEIADIEDPNLDLAKYSRLVGARLYEVELAAGEILYLPVGWWHQVTSLEFSVTMTYTNFLWPNDAHETYPGD
jgi:hypothetical protein